MVILNNMSVWCTNGKALFTLAVLKNKYLVVTPVRISVCIRSCLSVVSLHLAYIYTSCYLVTTVYTPL